MILYLNGRPSKDLKFSVFAIFNGVLIGPISIIEYSGIHAPPPGFLPKCQKSALEWNGCLCRQRFMGGRSHVRQKRFYT